VYVVYVVCISLGVGALLAETGFEEF
jgi:hypothetical protein